MSMKLKVTQKGVYDEKGNPVEVGTVIEHKGDSIPARLVNKVSIESAKPNDGEIITNVAENNVNAEANSNKTGEDKASTKK